MEALLAVLRVLDVLAFLSGAVRLADDAAKTHPQFQDNPPALAILPPHQSAGTDGSGNAANSFNTKSEGGVE